jgi:hypothetical protein
MCRPDEIEIYLSEISRVVYFTQENCVKKLQLVTNALASY